MNRLLGMMYVFGYAVLHPRFTAAIFKAEYRAARRAEAAEVRRCWSCGASIVGAIPEDSMACNDCVEPPVDIEAIMKLDISDAMRDEQDRQFMEDSVVLAINDSSALAAAARRAKAELYWPPEEEGS